MIKKIAICILIAIYLSISSVYANDASLGRFGETVYPLEDNDIEMISEEILIEYNPDIDSIYNSKVTCTFTFHNTSMARKVLMGFPATLSHSSDGLTTEDKVTLHNFTAKRNGVDIEVKKIEGKFLDDEHSNFPSWYVFEVLFTEGETLQMSHTYDMILYGDSIGGHKTGYILSTGATWKNNIQQAKIEFDFSTLNPYGIKEVITSKNNALSIPLSELSYSEGLLTLNKKDFKPDFDLEIYFSTRAAINAKNIEIYRTADEWESVSFFENAKNQNIKQIIKLYNELSYSNKLIETLYINSLREDSNDNIAPVASRLIINEEGDILVEIFDLDLNMRFDADIKMYDSSDKLLSEGMLIFHNSFKDYGSLEYKYDSGNLTNSKAAKYVVTTYDYDGNSSVTTFSHTGEILSRNPTNSIDNPNTSTQFKSFWIGFLLILMGLYLCLLRQQY